MIKALIKYPGRKSHLKFPITIAANAGLIEKGQVLARLTTGGKYVKFDHTASSTGAEVAVGIAPHEYPASTADQPGLCQYEGDFIKSDLVGLNAQAITSFGARGSDVLGQDLFILR